MFKVCDFGSSTTAIMLPGKDIPVALVEEQLAKYTTLQVTVIMIIVMIFLILSAAITITTSC